MTKNFDLDPTIIRTRQERIEMVADPDCPLDVLQIVAELDSELEVVEACAFNPNVTKPILKTVVNRTGKTIKQLKTSAKIFQFKNDPKIKNSFCTVPWNHIGTNADGNMRICCQMIYDDKEVPYGSLYKDDGTPVTGNDRIQDFRNVKSLKKLRKQFLNGERPDICKLCWDEEKNGINSRRQYSIDVFPEVVENAVINTQADGTIDPEQFPIEWWDLRFGNKCNLKCRSCGPTDSDQWYGDWIKLGKGNTFETRDRGVIEIKEGADGRYTVDNEFNWYEESELWEYIVDNLDKSKLFYFTGGEPTINHKHKELLKIIIDRGLAKDMLIEYNTNLAGVPEHIFELWSQFKKVNLGMSIDGIYEHFEYIRHPGKWRVAERNMRRIDQDPRLENMFACVTLTLSVMNVFHILDMMWWMKEQKWTRIDPNIIVHNLYGPEFYNIQNLPAGIKMSVEQQYNRFIDDINRRWPEEREWCHQTEKTLNSVLVHMKEKEDDPAKWKEFLSRSTELDAIRKESWTESLPELAEAIKNYNETTQRKRKIKLATADKRKS